MKKYDLLNDNGIKSERPSQAPLTQREMRRGDGGVSEEREIKTERGGDRKKEVGWAVGKGLVCVSELKNNYFTRSVRRSVTFGDA